MSDKLLMVENKYEGKYQIYKSTLRPDKCISRIEKIFGKISSLLREHIRYLLFKIKFSGFLADISNKVLKV